VATDITARKEAEAGIARSLNEVARLNEVLQNETTLHAEDEQILDNAFAKLGKLLEDTIGAIQMIVHQKDPPTARHQARVCKLACAIAREMGLAKGQVDTIGLAALLHDLGKVFIPADTLNKPGKLTEAEYSAVKNSAETEFQILKTIDLFYPIADIVHQHHERLNGSGYPVGIKGEDILMEARIIAVADVVEAMVSDRPYRPALTLEAALNEIESGKGNLYDPRVAEACITLFRESRFGFDSAETVVPQEMAYSGA
jgi:HD-GYP domain-containing protein (c-di-GMP phosphodiesterase class II)